MALRTCLPVVFVFACNNAPIYEGTSGPATDASGDTGSGSAPTSGGTTNAPSTTADPATNTGPETTQGPETTTGPETSGTGPETSAGTTGETTSGTACGVTLDVVFLLSRFAGMQDPQAKLREAVPALFETLKEGTDLDVRIMVSDMDRVFGSEECEDTYCPQNNGSSCAPLDANYPCGHSPTACEALYGASVFYPIGIGAANADCGFSPFLESVDMAALECALTVGEGTNSVDFGITLKGLLGPTNDPCNGGFIRDDATLLVVAVTNADDGSNSMPPMWLADTIAVRPLETVVIAGLTKSSPKIDQFIGAFPFAAQGSADLQDYSGTLVNAANLVVANQCGR